MPVDPFTHNHRRHTITHYGHTDDFRVESVQHVDQPVTVADLLDAHPSTSKHWKLREAADRAVKDSYNRVADVIDLHVRIRRAVCALSPEERAEFDRRTSG